MLLRFAIISCSLFLSSLYALTPDHKLAQDIHDQLTSGPQDYTHITVGVKNGVVTLKGRVKTDADKEKIEKAVQKMDNVHDINSQIQVFERKSDKSLTASFTQDSYSTQEDEELNKTIRKKMGSYWFWDSYDGLSLNTSNGVVTLEGIVDSVNDEQGLLQLIKQVNGVKSVRSNLEIHKD